MSTLLMFVECWLIGFAIAAPIGPIGMLCIRKTLELGFLGTVAVGLGAALADSTYGVIAGAGVSAITSFLLDQSVYIKCIGGAFLLFLGVNEIRKGSNPAKNVSKSPKGLVKLAIQTYFLTLANPLTILTCMSIFASIGGSSVTLNQIPLFLSGVFLGSVSWWFLLGGVILRLQKRLPLVWIDRIRYGSSLLLIGFGLWAIGTSLGSVYFS